MDLRAVEERIGELAAVDRFADPLHRAVGAALPRGPRKDALHGVWLGHPLHPLLTDLPIGFWTSAWVLDIVGGRRSRPAARRLVGLGVLSAVPTVAAGFADWSELERPERRVGAVHAVANAAATGLYALSYLARRRGRPGAGVALGWAGATAATAGGYLGGHLAYRRAAAVNRNADVAPQVDWAPVSLPPGQDERPLARGDLGGVPVVVASTPGGRHALAARCSHLGGPLDEGQLVGDGCLRCPWHASTFRLDDGGVVSGPATAPQPAYEVRELDGRTEVRSKKGPSPR